MADNLFTLIIYTTKYRLGGSQFPVVAETLADEKRREDPACEVITRAVESKHDVLGAIADIKTKGGKLKEFIFVGHSGMYGPMFGTVEFPEQFSPYEWEQMEIPFAENGSASFYCCRSARWFAPFFARTQNVPAHGFFWYTTFSKDKEKFISAGTRTDAPIYTIGCKGRKSHGYAAALKKRLGMMPSEKIKRFEPRPPDGDPSYDHVAELYDAVFEDIRVRRDEWAWLNEHISGSDLRVLDIGCGNGALLNALSSRIASGVGVDESGPMIEQAKKRNAAHAHLEFQKIDGPVLPFADAEFDIVISMMSFRYLDWDPLLAEIKRVTRPGGKFLIVDMVTVPVGFKEYPKLFLDKAKEFAGRRSNAKFEAALKRLVANPAWQKMVEYNPIRSEHEMKWYLESRFPGQKAEILNIGWNSRILAFDSGPVEFGVEAKLTYP